MANDIRHFAINADDLARARSFYEHVFGWEFQPWGPPDFFQIKTSSSSLLGALQKRREVVSGKPVFGFECTIAVEDVDATKSAVEANGGRVLMEKSTIARVGYLIFFEDPEGNVVGAMQYDSEAE